jgi:hypothetical protein
MRVRIGERWRPRLFSCLRIAEVHCSRPVYIPGRTLEDDRWIVTLAEVGSSGRALEPLTSIWFGSASQVKIDPHPSLPRAQWLRTSDVPYSEIESPRLAIDPPLMA